MNRLLIIGAGNFGREVLDWALAIPSSERDWEVYGFLDSRSEILHGTNCQFGIVGDPLTYLVQPGDRFICAVGEPKQKLFYARHIKARGGKFVNIIHPSTIIGSNCHIGEGCVFCPGAIITTNVVIGSFVTLNVYATVGHDARIGDGCTLSGHTDVTGWAVLGEGIFLGSHASVLPKAVVGDYAVIGAGSVVLRKVEANVTVMGVPAKDIYGGSRA